MPELATSPFGHALRHWRSVRHLSQLELATRAGTPSRHVSFLETGRARPSRDMVLRLAEALDVPPGDCNALLGAAGFGPQFSQRPLSDDTLVAVRDVLARLLESHAPFPALVLDAWYDVLDLNATAGALFAVLGLGAGEGPPNLVSLLVGPLRTAIVNWHEVLLDTRHRLRQALLDRPADARLGALLASVEDAAREQGIARGQAAGSPVLLTEFRTPFGVLRTMSVLVHFSGARDLTVQGMHVELIYPADAAADAMLRALALPDGG